MPLQGLVARSPLALCPTELAPRGELDDQGVLQLDRRCGFVFRILLVEFAADPLEFRCVDDACRENQPQPAKALPRVAKTRRTRSSPWIPLRGSLSSATIKSRTGLELATRASVRT